MKCTNTQQRTEVKNNLLYLLKAKTRGLKSVITFNALQYRIKFIASSSLFTKVLFNFFVYYTYIYRKTYSYDTGS